MLVTGGGPFDKTLFYALYLYEKSFRYYEMGYGSAMAWVLLVVIACFTTALFATSRNWVHYESRGTRRYDIQTTTNLSYDSAAYLYRRFCLGHDVSSVMDGFKFAERYE